MKLKSTRFLVSWIAIFLTLCVSCNQSAAKEPPINVVRVALTERLSMEAANFPLKESQLTPTDVRAILRDNLDPILLNEIQEATGTDFRFFSSDQQNEAHIAILIITYPDEKTALHMADKLAGIGGFFKRSKILIPFSSAATVEQVVIAFTENAGNEFVVKFIKDLPRLFEKK